MKVFAEMNTHIQESVQACNAQLYGCEIIPGPKNNTLRIYIDNPDGVTDQLCQNVGQHLMTTSAVQFPSLLNFTLEISSPGLNRRLFTIAQCQDNLGKKVKARTKMAISGQRNFHGLLQDASESQVVLATDNGAQIIEWSNIDKIRVQYEIGNAL